MATTTGKNAMAYFIGSLSAPLLAVIMTPFYLRQIGLEGLGLIGLMVMVTTVVGVFVAGASKSILRDISHAKAARPKELYSLIQGGLILFATVALGLSGIVLFAGGAQIMNLAADSALPPDILQRSIMIISFVFGLGIINSYFSSLLTALGDQIILSILGVGLNVALALTIWMALSEYPRVDVFYLCQLGGALVCMAIFGIRCKVIVSRQCAGKNQKRLSEVWSGRFKKTWSLSLTLIIHEGLGIVITQIDRLLITALFPLKSLGTYNLGANPARLSSLLVNPINVITFPELCAMVGRGDAPVVLGEYLGRLSYLMALLLSCALIVLVPSAATLMVLWLGEGQVPDDVPGCLTLLAIGHLLLGVAGPSYNLTVAFQRAGYGILQNIIALLVLPLLGWFAVGIWGIQGAALIWLIYSFAAVIVCMTFAYRRHASLAEGKRWLWAALLSISAASVIAIIICQLGISGLPLIGTCISVSITFFVLSMIRSFGFSPLTWLSAMEPVRATV